MDWTDIHKFDQLLTLEINSWHSPITDPIWQFFSDKLVWIPMYAAIIGLLFWKLGWKRGLMVLAAALLTFGFCDQFSNIVKAAVGRIRPLHDDFMVSNGLHILEGGGGLSFFSAHSANSFGLAFSTFIGMKYCLKTLNNIQHGGSPNHRDSSNYGDSSNYWDSSNHGDSSNYGDSSNHQDSSNHGGSFGQQPRWLNIYGTWMFFWAFMVAISRVFVGKHYLGDVLVGILVGSLAGYAFARLAGYVAKRIS